MKRRSPSTLPYLQGYGPDILAAVQQLIDSGRLAQRLRRDYRPGHTINTDPALYRYTLELKERYLRRSAPINKVCFDDKISVINSALGLHTAVSRVQGSKLKAKKEIRVASLFKQAPEPFVRMIVVHELAYLKEREHNKAFYSLCCHMEPSYHQLEFDLRLYLTYQDLFGPLFDSTEA